MMSVKDNSLGSFDEAREKMEEMRKVQAQFVSSMLNKSFELQQKQYTLLTSILQNQVEFGSALFSGAMSINDNLLDPERKAPARKK